MIIFDLDGTLADCEHRRHYVREPPVWIANPEFLKHTLVCPQTTNPEWGKFKPDWDAFYEACDKDKPIEPVIHIFQKCCVTEEVEIWSGRSENVKEKTIEWLDGKLNIFIEDFVLKMRPIGDNTPDDILKEKWLDETLAQGKIIEYVFDDRPKVIRMWRRRGIFVFNCNQSDEEF